MPRVKKSPARKFAFRRESTIVAMLIAIAVVLSIFHVVPSEPTCVFGDMRLRYDARVPPELSDIHLDAEHLGVGFGAAAVDGWDGLGDALAVGGRVFVRHTNRASSRYYNLASNRLFQSNAFVFVPSQRAPHDFYHIDGETRVDKLLDSLAARYPQGVVGAGLVRFATFRSIAMSAPAISGEPVTLRAAHYYKRPMEAADDSWAYVVVIAARTNDNTFALLLPPTSMRTASSGHAMALRLRSWVPATTGESFAENAISVGQLLKDAVAIQGDLALYPIAHASACPQALTSERPP